MLSLKIFFILFKCTVGTSNKSVSETLVPSVIKKNVKNDMTKNAIRADPKKYKNMIGGIKKDKFLDELKQEIKQHEKRTNTSVKSRGIGSDDHLWYEKKRLSLLK